MWFNSIDITFVFMEGILTNFFKNLVPHKIGACYKLQNPSACELLLNRNGIRWGSIVVGQLFR